MRLRDATRTVDQLRTAGQLVDQLADEAEHGRSLQRLEIVEGQGERRGVRRDAIDERERAVIGAVPKHVGALRRQTRD